MSLTLANLVFQLDSNGNFFTPGSSNPVPVTVVGGGGGGTASAFGAAFPATGTAIGFQDASGKMATVVLDGAGKIPVAGTFSSTPPTSNTSTAPAQTAVGTSASVILAANASRVGCAVQNTGTTKIYLALGHTPTSSAYFIALPAGGSANDGSSARWDGTVSGVLWTGAVSAISSGAGGICVVTELT